MAIQKSFVSFVILQGLLGLPGSNCSVVFTSKLRNRPYFAVAFVVLALVWERTTTPALIGQYGSKLKLAGFIGENREIWAPEWLFRSFLDSYRAESPLLQRRLTDVAMLRIVLPSVLASFCFAVEAFAIPVFSLEAAGFAAVCLARR